MGSTAPTVFERDGEHLVGAWNTLFVQFWGSHTRAPAVRNIQGYLTEFLSTHDRICAIVVIDSRQQVPDKATRAELNKLASLFADKTVCLAYVYEGTGFKAASVRAIMVALTLVRQWQHPY